MKLSDNLVNRLRYIDQIKPFMWNGNVKVITGIRRCGKSSVMRMFADTVDDGCNLIYINMEYSEHHDLREWKELLGHVNKKIVSEKKNLLFIDEVQDIPQWELAIRDFVAKGTCDVYLTGSNSNLLSSEYSTYLGGRFNRIHMFPLSYSECKVFHEKYDGKNLDKVFERFIRVGGFPILWRNNIDVTSSMQTIRDIVDVSISNDILNRFKIKNIQLLKDLLKCVVSFIGSYVSANNLFKELKMNGTEVSKDAVYEYLNHLEAANILIRANVFDIRGKKVLTSKYKYYVTDLGIKHMMLGYRPEDTPGHMENIIVTELLGRGYDVYVGDSDGKEIDIVAEMNGKRLYVQACMRFDNEKTMRREFGNLESIEDSFPKYVVTMDSGIYNGISEKGIVCCGLKEFLEKIF